MAPSWSELPSEGRLPSPVGVRDTPRTGQEEATGECPDAHLARFDRVCRASIFPVVTPAAAARIFTASLDDDAALWYDLTTSADEASPPPPWHTVRAAFLDFFRPPAAADRARAELVSRRQGPGDAAGLGAWLRVLAVGGRWCDDPKEGANT